MDVVIGRKGIFSISFEGDSLYQIEFNSREPLPEDLREIVEEYEE